MGEDGGAYKTMENLANQELTLEDMKLHRSVHQVISDMMESKATKLEHPTINNQCLNDDWDLSINNKIGHYARMCKGKAHTAEVEAQPKNEPSKCGLSL